MAHLYLRAGKTVRNDDRIDAPAKKPDGSGRFRGNKIPAGKTVLLLTCLVSLAVQLTFADTGVGEIIIDDFENGLHRNWTERKFKGKTDYRAVETETGKSLMADSKDSASLLIYRTKINPREYPVFTWRWKVAGILEKGDAGRKETDDYPARVYVLFHHWIPFIRKSICYIWANRLPKGSHRVSGYFGGQENLAVESGKENAGKWITEKRNIIEDYRRLFGGEPPSIMAVGIMTDTDNTGESATAWYDDLKFTKK